MKRRAAHVAISVIVDSRPAPSRSEPGEARSRRSAAMPASANAAADHRAAAAQRATRRPTLLGLRVSAIRAATSRAFASAPTAASAARDAQTHAIARRRRKIRRRARRVRRRRDASRARSSSRSFSSRVQALRANSSSSSSRCSSASASAGGELLPSSQSRSASSVGSIIGRGHAVAAFARFSSLGDRDGAFITRDPCRPCACARILRAFRAGASARLRNALSEIAHSSARRCRVAMRAAPSAP